MSLDLATVIRQVKQVLVEQGLGFANRIPEIERSIPIVTADSLGVSAGRSISSPSRWAIGCRGLRSGC